VRRRHFIAGALLLACKKSREVTVYTSVDQVFSEPVFRDFEGARGIKAKAVFDTEETKSTGVLNRLIAEADHPQADVFWSGDPVRPFSLIAKGLVDPYSPANADAIPQAFRAKEWTGVAARARVLLVNTNLVKEMPKSIRDLADPKWKGKTAIANPLFGTTTMHVAALFSVWGADKTKAFLGDLKTNQAKIASSNGEVKRLVSQGEAAFGLADTDDAHEAIEEKAPVQVVYPDQDDLGTLVMPTSIVVIKNGPHPDEARRLADWLVSAEVEKKLAESAAHMPLRADVAAPAGMKRIADLRAMQVDYAKVASEMEANQPWLREWVGL
jgi:iron(III) transport system substrate-binding protein